jgi:hypothetical protein
MRAPSLLLVGLAVLAGCGGEDDDGGAEKEPKTAPAAKVERPAGLSREERKVADGVAELLEAKDGDEACFASLGAQYVESLGGNEKCARAFDPLVTGDYNKISSVKVLKPGDQGEAEAEVTSASGGSPVELELDFASPGAWNVTGASNLPR